MAVSAEDFVARARQSQIPEDTIKKVLKEKGHAEEEIAAAFGPDTPTPPDAGAMNAIAPPGASGTPPPPPSAGTGETPQNAFQKAQGQSKALALGAEYALPAAVTLMMPESLLLTLGPKAAPYVAGGVSAVATGAGTLLARQIEGKDPIMDQLKDASVAMAADVAINLGLSTAGRMIAKRVLKKGEVAKDVTGFHTMAKDAQDVLGETVRDTKLNWYGAPKTGQWTRGDTGSLTMGGIEGTSSELAKTVEGFLRGSFIGKGKFKQADELNMNAIEEVYSSFISQMSNATDDVRFGKVLQSMTLGPPNPTTGKVERPQIFGEWINNTKNELYNSARSTYEGKGLMVNIESVRQQMKKFEGSPEFDQAFAVMREYIPAPTRTVPGKAAYQKPTGQLDSFGNEVLEVVPKEADTIVPVNEIPAERAILLKRDLNRALKGVGGKWQGDINAIAGQGSNLRREILTSLQGADDAGAAFQLAEAFTGTAGTLHDNALIKGVTKKLSSNPTSVLSYIESAPRTADALDQLERMWSFARGGYSGKVPGAVIPTFEDAVLRPLRFDILNKAYDPTNGAFNPKGIKEAVKDYDPTTINRLFGPDGAERLEKISNAAAYLKDYNFPDKIIPTMVESGLLASVGFGAATGSTGAAATAAKTLSAILLIDASLSRMFASPKLANRVIDGLSFGPTDSRFMASMYTLVSEGIADMTRMRQKNPQAAQFYSLEGYTKRQQLKEAGATAPVIAPSLPQAGLEGMQGGAPAMPPMLP